MMAQASLDQVSAQETAKLLMATDVRSVGGSPTRETIADLLPTLRARQGNALARGTLIFGQDGAVAAMSCMAPDAIVIGYGFLSSKMAGVLYLEEDCRRLIGVTVVNRLDRG